MGDTVEAIGYKTDVKSRAADKVSGTVDSVRSKIGGAGSRVNEASPGTEDVKQSAGKAAGVAQENPIGLALGSLARCAREPDHGERAHDSPDGRDRAGGVAGARARSGRVPRRRPRRLPAGRGAVPDRRRLQPRPRPDSHEPARGRSTPPRPRADVPGARPSRSTRPRLPARRVPVPAPERGGGARLPATPRRGGGRPRRVQHDRERG
jgi:hypothetical protein